MRGHAKTLIVVATVGALAGLAPSSRAVPVFARKYGFNCTMCHSSYPRLNDFGQRFRRNGYRIPGRESVEKMVYEAQAPFAMRTSAGYNSETYRNLPDATDVSQFQLNGLDVLSAGLLGPNAGYFAVYTPEIKGARGVAPQTGMLESANVILTAKNTTWFTARIGRFEPAYAAFSVKRSLTVAPYEVYDFSSPNGVPFSDTQTGIEIAGWGRNGYRYAAGVVNGSGSNNDSDAPLDFYARGEKVFGSGEGQTAGQRLGFTVYRGIARPGPGMTRKSFTRLGVDTSLNLGAWSLGAQFLHGEDHKDLWAADRTVTFDGGFAELLYQPTTHIVGFARYDWVSTPADLRAGVSRWTVGSRYYLEDSVAIHLEYSARSQSPVSSGMGHATERLFTLRMDFGF